MKLADPAYADELDTLIAEFGEAQARFEELGGYGSTPRRARILAGSGLRKR